MTGTPILLVSTAPQSYGTARIPAALAEAGFDVALLAPEGALAEKSAFVGKVGHVPNPATPLQWVYAFSAMVKAIGPRLVVPCDDMSLRLLQSLVVAPPENMVPALQRELAALIGVSLGDPAGYRPSTDRTLMPAAAAALGVGVPECAVLADPREAEAFAAAHGYPVNVKRGYSLGGQGSALCAGPAEIADAYARFARLDRVDAEGANGGRYLVQVQPQGARRYCTLAAWQGSLLAGWASEPLVANPAPRGPPTVLRVHHSPALRTRAEALVRGFAMSGLCDLEFALDERTGEASLVEIHRRVTPLTHCGRRLDVDLGAALHAAVQGDAPTSRADLDPGEERITVLFPEEWLRDAESAYLRDYPVDAPWEDPPLLEAMLALGGAAPVPAAGSAPAATPV